LKIKKNADCRQKEKKKGGDEEGRSSLMPKLNEILQQGTQKKGHGATPFYFSLDKTLLMPSKKCAYFSSIGNPRWQPPQDIILRGTQF
jgi:hypothetical protein